MLWLCFKLPSCLFSNNRDMSVMHEKATCVCFINMQLQKVKFKVVQINMKQVSYVQFQYLTSRGGVCGQNICYHNAVFVIPFNLFAT